jgi:uncharacterized membrane protein
MPRRYLIVDTQQNKANKDEGEAGCTAILRRWLVIANLYIWVFICGALFGGGVVYAIAQRWVPGMLLSVPPRLVTSALSLPSSAITENGLKVSVVNVDYTSQAPGKLFGNRPQGVFMAVTLSLENTTRQPVGALFPEQGYFLTDRQGRMFIPDIEATLSGREIAVLNPGLSLEIILYFDVPPDTNGYTLHVFDTELPLE